MLSIVLPRQTGEVRGGAKRSRNISRKTRFPWAVHVVRFFDYALRASRGMKPTGGDIFGTRQRYLRTRTEISLDKSGDIRPQSRIMDRQIKCLLVIFAP